jgi:hypothetical protein
MGEQLVKLRLCLLDRIVDQRIARGARHLLGHDIGSGGNRHGDGPITHFAQGGSLGRGDLFLSGLKAPRDGRLKLFAGLCRRNLGFLAGMCHDPLRS